MTNSAKTTSNPIARGKWNSLVKAAALLGGAVFVFFLTKNPRGPADSGGFSEVGRWMESTGRGEIEWTGDGSERLFEEGRKIDERPYRVLEKSATRLVIEHAFSKEELEQHPEWNNRGRVEYGIQGPNRLRREFSPESGVKAMELERREP